MARTLRLQRASRATLCSDDGRGSKVLGKSRLQCHAAGHSGIHFSRVSVNVPTPMARSMHIANVKLEVCNKSKRSKHPKVLGS
jgi:hypothetical protein